MSVIVMVIALAWLLVAVAAALVVGASIRLADRNAPATDDLVGLPADLTVEDILGQRPVQSSHR